MNENLVILTWAYLLPNHSRGSLRGRQRVDLTLSRIQRIWPPPSRSASIARWANPKRTLGCRWSSGGSLERAVQSLVLVWRHLMLGIVSHFGRRMRACGWVAFERGRVKITPTKIRFSNKLGQKGNYWLSLPRGFCLKEGNMPFYVAHV